MIDSSGRKALRANGTVFDLLPVGQCLGVLGSLLVVLFTLVKPEASNGLGNAARFAFWSLHVFLGLGALWLAGRWLASGERLPGSTLGSVLVTGLFGVLLATPGYLLLDALFAPHIIDLDPDPPAGTLPLQWATEVFELAPWFIASWVIINLPVLMSAQLTVGTDDSVDYDPDDDPSGSSKRSTGSTVSNDAKSLKLVSGQSAESVSPRQNEAATPSSTSEEKPGSKRFLQSLPGFVGTDIVAVASDLHYLNVWTVAGRTTILGNMRDVVDELDEMGMQVHRSHWVAHAHVKRVLGNSSNAVCILSNELRVPISRRRWKAVREHYGRGVVHAAQVKSA